MSGALDALTSFKIDAATKTVEVEQHTPRRESAKADLGSAAKLGRQRAGYLPLSRDLL